jgi:hypothetical protein
MRVRKNLVVIGAAMALSACGGRPVAEISPKADMGASRWNAVIGTPDAMRGIVGTRGYATMSETEGGKRSRIDVRVENAVPGGRHPWALRSGQCGALESELLRVSDGNALRIGDDGKAKAEQTADLKFPSSGNYAIVVMASAENTEQVVACGNLAPPTNR